MLREENKYDAEGRLRPVYRIQRPRWVGLYTNREYKGPLNWWSELGHTDAVTLKNKIMPQRYAIAEKDPEWYDPPVKESEALRNAFGGDSKYTPNYALKGDTPIPLWDYKRKLLESSVQYKQIADKYDLSPEHPGLRVNPILSDHNYRNWMNLGSYGFLVPGQLQHQWGPRFFDKPMNEGCFEKGLALVKYVAIANMGITIIQFQSEVTKEQKQIVLRDLARRWLRLMPYPSVLAFGYGASMCASSAIRNIDDVYNTHVAAATTAIISAAIKGNVPVATFMGLALALGGSFWHYQRCMRYGIQLPQYIPYAGGDSRFGGAHWWKTIDFGHATPRKDIF